MRVYIYIYIGVCVCVCSCGCALVCNETLDSLQSRDFSKESSEETRRMCRPFLSIDPSACRPPRAPATPTTPASRTTTP